MGPILKEPKLTMRSQSFVSRETQFSSVQHVWASIFSGDQDFLGYKFPGFYNFHMIQIVRVWRECGESVGRVWGECWESVVRVWGECGESVGTVW